MNIYWAGGLLLAFVLWSGFMYHAGSAGETHVCGEADAKHDLAQAGVTIDAQRGVIDTIGKQQAATQGVDISYEKQRIFIDSQYGDSLVGVQFTPAGTSYNLPALPSAPVGLNAAPSRPPLTKIYKLNSKECDANTAQLYGLQAWVTAQQKVAGQSPSSVPSAP